MKAAKALGALLVLGGLFVLIAAPFTGRVSTDPAHHESVEWNRWSLNNAVLNRGLANDAVIANGDYYGSGITVGNGSSDTTGVQKIVEWPSGTFEGLALDIGSTSDDDEAVIVGWPVFLPEANRPIHMGFQGSASGDTLHQFYGIVLGGKHAIAGALIATSGAAHASNDMIGFHWTAGTNTSFTFRVSDGGVVDSLIMTGIVPTSTEDFELFARVGLDTAWVYGQDEDSEFSGTLVLTNNGPITDLGDMAPNITAQNEGIVVNPKVTLWRAFVSQKKRGANRASFIDEFKNPFP